MAGLSKTQILVAAAPAALVAAGALALFGALKAAAPPEHQAAISVGLKTAAPMALVLWGVVSAMLGQLALKLWRHWAAAPGILAEQVRALVASDVVREVSVPGGKGVQELAAAVNALVADRSALRQEMDTRVKEASGEVEQEKQRLAALMSELQQAVVVCNLDGRILLYNNRARLQFRALSDAPEVASGGELIGLGRSIYAVLDRRLVAHALESVQHRVERGAANPSAQFVTSTRQGQLLRVHMTAVRALGAEAAAAPERKLSGFVLMLDNITRDFAEEGERDRMLHQLTETSRASLGNLQVAVEILDDPGLDEATRERFQAVVRDECAAMGQRIQELATHTTHTVKTRWPLEDMLGQDLVAASVKRIHAATQVRVSEAGVDSALWLKVDSFSVLQALSYLAQRLVDEYEIKTIQLRLAPAAEADAAAGAAAASGRSGSKARRAQLDLVWIGPSVSTETVTNWETEAMRIGNESTALTVRDVVERHGGAFWFERERARQASFFRFLLPLAEGGAPALEAADVMHSDSRPEYYDFDLFRAGAAGASEWADTPLAELSYTVFDTETTGLDPAGGDEIIQFGSVRIVAGKLRRQECFEQLVDPQRDIPAAGIPIHGIEPQMVEGQPTIDTVLPAFAAFAADTVLVAHNAAFDMRFLQLKEERTGIKFTQPVLDTLLLSAVATPQQESHSLEAIAERLGVDVLGRHNALGDAMVTAEIFVKLIPLLEAQGVRTLGQALEAAQKTYYARVQY